MFTNVLTPDAWIPALDASVSLEQELNLPAASSVSEGHVYHTRQEGLEPEQLLAMAVIRQAVDDWQAAAAVLALRPNDPAASRMRRDTERFLQSRWCAVLADLDGRALLERLRKSTGLPDASAPAARRAEARQAQRADHCKKAWKARQRQQQRKAKAASQKKRA